MRIIDKAEQMRVGHTYRELRPKATFHWTCHDIDDEMITIKSLDDDQLLRVKKHIFNEVLKNDGHIKTTLYDITPTLDEDLFTL